MTRALAAWPLAALVGVAVGVPVGGVPPREIRVEVRPVALDPSQPARCRVGELKYQGGLELRSDDRRFGGLSDLLLSDDGHTLLAVSDEGDWLRARLVRDAAGRLVGLEHAVLGALLGPNAAPLEDKSWQDAESLAWLPDGRLAIGFERRHRIWAYRLEDGVPSGAPEGVAAPPDLQNAPDNGGLEALTSLGDGSLFAVSEELSAGSGVRAWAGGPDAWRPLEWPVEGLPRPSAATRLPSGDLVVVERGYSPLTGVVVRLQLVAQPGPAVVGRLEPHTLAELRAPLSVDNFEGVAARLGRDGRTSLLLLSDDNFSPTQRTLLLQFEIGAGAPRPDPVR